MSAGRNSPLASATPEARPSVTSMRRTSAPVRRLPPMPSIKRTRPLTRAPVPPIAQCTPYSLSSALISEYTQVTENGLPPISSDCRLMALRSLGCFRCLATMACRLRQPFMRAIEGSALKRSPMPSNAWQPKASKPSL